MFLPLLCLRRWYLIMIASHKELEQTKHKYDTGRNESDGADDRRTPATVVSDTTYATAVASVHMIYYLIYLITPS